MSFSGSLPGGARAMPIWAVPSGGRDFDPAVAVLKGMVHHDAETQLVGEETQAPFLVAHEDDDEVQAQIRISAVETETGAINAEGQFGRCHRRDYTGAAVRVSPTKSG